MSLNVDVSVLPTFDVRPVVLEEGKMRLEPLGLEHIEGLMECTAKDTFEFFPKGVEAWNREGFEEYMRWRNGEGFVTLAILVGGEVVGLSSYFDIGVEHRRLEIGHTYLGKSVRGSWVNPRMKRLMIGHAIDEWGALRVQFKTDARNWASRKAMEKMGFPFEGILRSHVLMPDGYSRDSVFFGVTFRDWEEVKGKLLELEMSRL